MDQQLLKSWALMTQTLVVRQIQLRPRRDARVASCGSGREEDKEGRGRQGDVEVSSSLGDVDRSTTKLGRTFIASSWGVRAGAGGGGLSDMLGESHRRRWRVLVGTVGRREGASSLERS